MRLVPFVAIMAALFPAGSPLRAEETFTPGPRVEGDFDGIATGFLEQHFPDCPDHPPTQAHPHPPEPGPGDEAHAGVRHSVLGLGL